MSKKLALNIGIGASINKSLGKSFDQVQKESEDLGKQQDKLNKKLGAAREVKKYRSQLDKLQKRMEAGAGDTLAMSKVQSKLEQQLRRSERAARAAGVDIRNLSAEERRLAHQTEQTNKQLTRQQTVMRRQARMSKAAGMARSGAGMLAMGAAGAVGMGAAAATAGVAAAARVAGSMDDAYKASQRLGSSFEELQQLHYAGAVSGIDAERMNDLLKEQALRISEATQGTGEGAEALEALGINAQSLMGMAPEDQLEAIADKLKEVQNVNDRLRLSEQLWGGEGTLMLNLVNDGAEGIRRLKQEALETGNVLSEQNGQQATAFSKQLTSSMLALSGVGKQLGVQVLPPITGALQSMSGWLKDNRESVTAFTSGIGNLISIMRKVAQVYWSVVGPVLTAIGSGLGWGLEKLNSLMGEGISEQGSAVGNDILSSGPPDFPDDSLMPPMAQTVNSGGVTVNSSPTITVNQQPGESTEEVTGRLKKMLEDRDREQAKRYRGLMYDLSPASL